MIRVGRTEYNKTNCEYPGFTPIMVTTASRSGKYKDLSPYYLCDENGHIFENIWQFAKIYPKVPKISIPMNRYNPKIIWSWGAETHIDKDGKPTEEYWKWRETGTACSHPVRYPVGFHNRSTCAGLYTADGQGPFDYIESRKRLYLPDYVRLVREVPVFKELKKRLESGENLLILDVDGPVQKSMSYYMKKYGVEDNWIDKNTILATEANLNILLNDPKHPFGHGFCLTSALLNLGLC